MNFYKVTFEFQENVKTYGYYICSSLFNLVDWLIHEDNVGIYAINSIKKVRCNSNSCFYDTHR